MPNLFNGKTGVFFFNKLSWENCISTGKRKKYRPLSDGSVVKKKKKNPPNNVGDMV